jgi:diaminohydroxyphosphoribosylaminopyrimidine deaminase/5-amino-6-(5-phosphoribosylamino)uracil reductase
VNENARDERYVRRALELARQGLGCVEPNPMVGAVLVQGDRIVGEGWHARFGGPHAEVVAIQSAGQTARDAELFVTLEPCCHHGKTPPCTDAILTAGIRRVVAAIADPFPQVSGRGEAILREAGLEVKVGVLEADARRLNAAFFKRQLTGLPLVIAKWAMTLDGCLATAAGDSRWISCEESRRRVHEVRRIVDAVLVGAGTARKDEPLLTVRHVKPIAGRGQPTRVVLDEGLSIDPLRQPAASARETPVLIYTTDAGLVAGADRAARLRQAGCEIVAVAPEILCGGLLGHVAPPPSAVQLRQQRLVPAEGAPPRAAEPHKPSSAGGVSPRAVLEDLGRRGMSRVLVEGGARLFGSFLTTGLVDRVMVFIAPRLLAGRGLPPVIGPDGRTLRETLDLKDLEVERVGTDVLVQGRIGEF